MATRLRRVFSEPEKVGNTIPLIPPLSLLGGNFEEVCGVVERFSSDRSVWASTAKTVGGNVASSVGLRDYVSRILSSNGLPSPRISSKDGVVGFDLAFGEAVCGMVSKALFGQMGSICFAVDSSRKIIGGRVLIFTLSVSQKRCFTGLTSGSLSQDRL